MRIKKYLAAICLFIVCNIATGQSLKSNFSENKITGRFNALGILDLLDANISLGAECRFNEHWSTGSDAAYIFSSDYLSESKVANGFIVRPFIRYYPKKNRYDFFEAELHYKFVAYQITDWLGKDAVNGVPAYEVFTTFNYKKKVYGLSIKAGSQENLSKDKRLRFEFYIGLGYRYKEQGAGDDIYDRRNGTLLHVYDPTYSSISIPLGIRFLYDIKYF